MTSVLKLFAGLAAVAALGIFSIEMDILPGSRADAQARLRERADQALAAVGADWAQAQMQGQEAVLSGEAPDRTALAHAAKAIRRSTWSGGPLIGGVSAVDASGVTIEAVAPPVVNPFVWVAERHGEDVVFSGYAPSAEARAAVYRFAAAHFPQADISGDLDVAQGAPPEDAWLSAAAASLQALAQLEDGAVAATGSRFEVSGRAANSAKAETVRTLMNSLPAGISGAADIAAPPPQPSPVDLRPTDAATEDGPSGNVDSEAGPPPGERAPADATAPAAEDAPAEAETPSDVVEAETAAQDQAAPEAGAEAGDDANEPAGDETAPPPPEPAAQSAPSAQAEPEPAEAAEPVDPALLAECRSRLERFLIGLQVSFSSEGTAIAPESQEPLRALATTLAICPYFTVEITGHTDASGSEFQNRRLSLERAEAVAAFLRSFGVEREMLTPRGAGSSDPLADNSTPEGRALNRRIEFTLAPDTVE